MRRPNEPGMGPDCFQAGRPCITFHQVQDAVSYIERNPPKKGLVAFPRHCTSCGRIHVSVRLVDL